MKCPQCNGPLDEVPRHSNWLNDEQYAAVKAGDWYCTSCPSNERGNSPFCYWWNSEVFEHQRRSCDAAMRL